MSDDPTEFLVSQFAAASRAHYDATMAGDYERANLEVDRIHTSFLRLRDIGAAGREALIGLAAGEDAAAVMAATYSLKYDSSRSLDALKRLSKDKGVLGFQASQAVKRWKSGEWQLE